mgnify:FL=1|jgi:hypothetical protein
MNMAGLVSGMLTARGLQSASAALRQIAAYPNLPGEGGYKLQSKHLIHEVLTSEDTVWLVPPDLNFRCDRTPWQIQQHSQSHLSVLSPINHQAVVIPFLDQSGGISLCVIVCQPEPTAKFAPGTPYSQFGGDKIWTRPLFSRHNVNSCLRTTPHYIVSTVNVLPEKKVQFAGSGLILLAPGDPAPKVLSRRIPMSLDERILPMPSNIVRPGNILAWQDHGDKEEGLFICSPWIMARYIFAQHAMALTRAVEVFIGEYPNIHGEEPAENGGGRQAEVRSTRDSVTPHVRQAHFRKLKSGKKVYVSKAEIGGKK